MKHNAPLPSKADRIKSMLKVSKTHSNDREVVWKVFTPAGSFEVTPQEVTDGVLICDGMTIMAEDVVAVRNLTHCR